MLDNYFGKLGKKKDRFGECSDSNCEHLKCNLGQNPENCVFKPIDEKKEEAKKIANIIDNIPIIGTGTNVQGFISSTVVILFGLIFIAGTELVLQTPDCEKCEPSVINFGKNSFLGWILVTFGLWSLTAPKNAKIWLDMKLKEFFKPMNEFILRKIRRKKETI